MTHTFFNRKGVLYLRVNLGKTNKRITRTTKIPIGDAQVVNNKVVGMSKVALLANSTIHEIEQQIAAGIPIDKIFSEDKVEVEAKTTFAEAIQQVKSKKDTKSYDTPLNRYKEYVGDFDIIIEDNNLQVIVDHKKRQQVIREMNSHWEGFIDFLADRGITNSSIATYLNKIGAVVKHIYQYNGIEIPFNASVKVINTEPYVWPVSVTEKFLSINMDSPMMDAAKLMIYTCLRPGDALKIRKDNFRKDGDVHYVEKLNSKNQVVTKAPIPESAWHELKDCTWTGISLRAFRHNLSSLLVECGIDRPEYIYEQRGNKVVRVESSLVQATTPKTLRKCGINRYAEKGMDADLIREFYSGHRSVKVFNTHYRKTELKKVL